MVDELVGLRTAETALRAQPGKLLPLIAVSGGVGVEIHLLE